MVSLLDLGLSSCVSVTDPKEEREEEEEVSNVAVAGVPVSAARPPRGWRSSRAAAVLQCEAENARSSRAKAGSLQLICKSEPNTDQLEFGRWSIKSLGNERFGTVIAMT